MATPRVAACLHPDWHHVELKTDGPSFGSSLDLHRDCQHFTAEFDLQFRLAIGDRIKRGPFTTAHRRIPQRIRRLFRDIASDAVCLNRLDDNELTILRRRQVNVRRRDIQLHQR